MDNNNTSIGNWFLDQLAVYQTANSDYQAVKNNFIVRKAEYNIIIDAIINKKANDPLQHELILGRRGSGKSTLLKRIEIEIVENPKLSKNFIAINLAEEQAGIYRLFDLWEQVINELKKQYHFAINIPDYNSFKNDQKYTRQLFTLINESCTKNKKRIVLLLDNFDRIIENFTDDGRLLREILINHNTIQIIAGSTRMDEHFWRYDMPFYDFFRTHKLVALTREEMDTLLKHWSVLLNIESLKEFVKNNPGRIENIRILTDGLPRTLQFFIQIVLQKSETSTYDYLKKTMDNVSPLYQERLNSLTAQLRKTVFEMAFIWEACTTKQLVEKVKMESKLISANLKTLVEKGIVDKIETNKKQHLYRISERFFNMWLIITQGNPDQKRKAKWLSVFLENWYNATDFKKLANDHIANLMSGKTDWNSTLLMSKGLSQSKYISVTERDEIIKLTEKIKGKGIENCLIELPEKSESILTKIIKHRKEKNYPKAVEIAKTIENEEDGIKFFILGILYKDQKKYTKAETYYLKAIEKGHISASYNLANLYINQQKYNEAENYYLKAIEKGVINALYNLAKLYYNQQKYAEAETYYLKAIEKGHIGALNNLAILYKNQQKIAEAETYYLKAIEKGHISALYNLANLYINQQKYNEAENYYLKAIEKGHIGALNNLANLYYFQQKYSEAETYYLNAIEKGDINAIFNLAIFYEKQQKYIDAENFYLKAFEKGHIVALNNLAYLFYKTNNHKTKALQYINKAFKTEKDFNTKETQIIIEIWNGIFNNIEQRAIEIIESRDDAVINELIFDLLVQQQKRIVLNLFENKELGKELQEKYTVLYYVTLILNKVNDDNLLLKIPPELQSTIDDILLKIETKQKFYGY